MTRSAFVFTLGWLSAIAGAHLLHHRTSTRDKTTEQPASVLIGDICVALIPPATLLLGAYLAEKQLL